MHLQPPTFCESEFNHQGLTLRTYEWGMPSRTRPTLIFLHGWLDHGASWNSVATHLSAKGYHCLALDHRGHGHSDHLPPYEEYHFIDYVSDLQAWMGSMNLPRFVLVGHSMGGTIASIFTALSQLTPEQCILIDGLGPKHESPAEATQRLRLHLSQRTRIPNHRPMTFETACRKLHRAHPFLSQEGLELECRRLTRPLNPSDHEQSDHGQSDQASSDLAHTTSPTFTWRWDPRHRHKAAIGFSLPRFLDVLGHIDVPTHAIFGKDSWYVQLPDLPSRLKSLTMLTSNIQLPSGHSPHLECPMLLSEAIDTCLQS